MSLLRNVATCHRSESLRLLAVPSKLVSTPELYGTDFECDYQVQDDNCVGGCKTVDVAFCCGDSSCGTVENDLNITAI